jgi:hypothetical protein
MTSRRELDEWLRDSEWVTGVDATVGADAMRCRPGPVAVPSYLRGRVPPRPAARPARRGLTPEEVQRRRAEANDRWVAIGHAYRDLAAGRSPFG